MAGSFPNAPAPRIPYHLDTDYIVKHSYNNTVVTLTQAQMTYLNDETMRTNTLNMGGLTYLSYVSFYFPVNMDISGYFYAQVEGGNITYEPTVYTSTNTTNGQDGTWTSQGAATVYESTTLNYRDVTTVSLTSIRGIRFEIPSGRYGQKVANIHLYGAPSSTPTTGLAIWDPSSDVRLGGAALDFGTSTRGTTSSAKTFRVKNLSTTQTANTITVSLSGTAASTYTLSTDDVTYSSSVSIGSLSSGTISSVIYIKKTTASNTTLGATTALLTAEPASWS